MPKRKTITLGWLLLALMATQAGWGLLQPGVYRDADWLRAAWLGNDLVTLVVACPLLLCSLWLAARDSARARLALPGMLAYAVYNYAYYLLGAALNACFPLYAALFVLAASALILVLADLPVIPLAAGFCSRTPVRLIGGYLVFVGAGLAAVWLGMWAAHVFFGRPTPGSPEVFRLVAALDLTLIAPVLCLSGVLLWRRRAWGYALAAIASLLGALYLLVLTVNSAIAIAQGRVPAPGELPVWGTLFAATASAAAALLVQARR